MRKEHDEPLDPKQPYVVVVYGATKRKCRPLRGDVVVIGRSPGCDIGLVSPEVASVHCVLVRLAEGWRVRDCSGRSTRINGRAIHEEPLKDGDVVQIGAFSFEVRLPAVEPKPVPAATADEISHLQHSRRNFAELAIRLRARVREKAHIEAELARRETDLEQMERRLRSLHPESRGKVVESDGAESLRVESDQLDTRSEELNLFALHLRRQEQRLHERESVLAREIEAEPR